MSNFTTGSAHLQRLYEPSEEQREALRRASRSAQTQKAIAEYRRMRERDARMAEINARIDASNRILDDPDQLSPDEYAALDPADRQAARDAGIADRARGTGVFTPPLNINQE